MPLELISGIHLTMCNTTIIITATINNNTNTKYQNCLYQYSVNGDCLRLLISLKLRFWSIIIPYSKCVCMRTVPTNRTSVTTTKSTIATTTTTTIGKSPWRSAKGKTLYLSSFSRCWIDAKIQQSISCVYLLVDVGYPEREIDKIEQKRHTNTQINVSNIFPLNLTKIQFKTESFVLLFVHASIALDFIFH